MGLFLEAESITRVCCAFAEPGPGVTRRLDAFLKPVGRDPMVTVHIRLTRHRRAAVHAEKSLQAARKHAGERKMLEWLPLCSSLYFLPGKEEWERTTRSLISGINAEKLMGLVRGTEAHTHFVL